MRTTFQCKSDVPKRSLVPIRKFNFAAYPVEVKHALRHHPVTGRPPTKSQNLWQRGLRTITKFAAAVFVLCLAWHSEAQNYVVGVRAGTSFETDAGNFQQADVYAGKYLPWLWGHTNGLNLKPRWEVSAGCLHNEGKQGVVGTTGPVIEVRIKNFPLTLEGGVSLSALSQYQFPDRDLGGWFEFTDHAGIDWHINKRLTFGWRFQHMSNAAIYRKNPGLNLQMLSAAYSF